ncbi:MAG: hypothetical protein WCO86_04265 [Planctomycetota bacterium]
MNRAGSMSPLQSLGHTDTSSSDLWAFSMPSRTRDSDKRENVGHSAADSIGKQIANGKLWGRSSFTDSAA